MTFQMRIAIGRARVLVPALLVASCLACPCAAADQDKPQPKKPAKPMVKHEPMAGEMKKDGMMKEDVSKSAKAWDQKMEEAMKQEKMK